MNKRKILSQKIDELKHQLKELEHQECQKIGTLVLNLYEKNKIADVSLKSAIAKILGDSISPKPQE